MGPLSAPPDSFAIVISTLGTGAPGESVTVSTMAPVLLRLQPSTRFLRTSCVREFGRLLVQQWPKRRERRLPNVGPWMRRMLSTISGFGREKSKPENRLRGVPQPVTPIRIAPPESVCYYATGNEPLRPLDMPSYAACRGTFVRMPLVASLAGVLAASAQPLQSWRQFSPTDGLVERYVGAVSVGRAGLVYVTHGNVRQMSTFDGFTVRRLPSPGLDVRVEEGMDGELWAIQIQPGRPATGLQMLSGKNWMAFPISDFAPADPEQLITAAGARRFHPFAKGHVLYVARDGLRDFDAITGKSRPLPLDGCPIGPITSLLPAGSSSYWIAGERGIARVRVAVPPGGAAASCEPWTRQLPSGPFAF